MDVHLLRKDRAYADSTYGGSLDEEIADILNRRGYRTKNGSAWYPSMVRYILGNDVYADLQK